jgi:hypothetical protein
MAGKLLHIVHQLRDARLRSRSAYTSPKRNGLACNLAVEGAEKESRGIGWVYEVKTGPVDVGGG